MPAGEAHARIAKTLAPHPMNYLCFDLSDTEDGVTTLDAMASTQAEQHAAVMAEVQQVLDWAWRQFPHTHGPIDEGMDWDHDLQVHVEAGGWHVVALTLTGSARFAQEFIATFGDREA
jgi:hypothetical protein